MKGSTLVKLFFAASTLLLINIANANSFCPDLFTLPPWGPQATVGGVLGFPHNNISSENDNKFLYGNLIVPVHQDGNSLWYVDGRQTINSDCCNLVTSLGGGYRKIINNSYILGGYGFVDYEHSGYGNNFYQGNLGGEYLSPTWQVRVNGYMPITDRNEPTDNGPPIHSDDQPPIYPGSIALVEYPYLEHAEAGGDLEVGSALPFAPSFVPFVGYYHFGFDQDTYIDGGRAGLQYTYNRWITLFAGDQYDNLHKNTALLGASVMLGGANHAPNPSAIVNSLMEESPFGINGIF